MTVRTSVVSGLRAMRDRLDPAGAKRRQEVEAKITLAQQHRFDDLRWLMHDQRGRRIVYALLDTCGYQGTTINDHGRPSAILEGQRLVAIRLARELVGVDPEAWLRMLREAMDASTT